MYWVALLSPGSALRGDLGPGQLQHYGLRQDRQLWPQIGTGATTQAGEGPNPRAIKVRPGRTRAVAPARRITLPLARLPLQVAPSPMRPTCADAPGPGLSRCPRPDLWPKLPVLTQAIMLQLTWFQLSPAWPSLESWGDPVHKY
jgi:hypothetical protein